MVVAAKSSSAAGFMKAMLPPGKRAAIQRTGKLFAYHSRGRTAMAKDDKAPNSSIVMRAIDATTFSEMQAFTKDLESRPIERLLRDVADLVKISDSKAQIVGYVIAMKFRRASEEERANILGSLENTVRRLQAGEQRERVQAIIDRIRTQES
jgi:hypothetical protein